MSMPPGARAFKAHPFFGSRKGAMPHVGLVVADSESMTVELALKNLDVDQRQGRQRACGLTSHEQLLVGMELRERK
jgi:hypothetical protein